MPVMKIPRKLLPFQQKQKRFKIALGGRGSAKSMTFTDLCLMDAQMHGIKTACFREYQNSIDDSVYALLSSEIQRLELQGFEVQSNRILYQAKEMFKFRGLARNPEGVKSMHGFKRFWVEEGQAVSAKSLQALTPTLREADSEIWISANPLSSSDPFSERFIMPFYDELLAKGYYEDDLHLIVWVNYTDNPFFPEVLEKERANDEKILSRALYNHIWLGHFYDEVEDGIIPVEWFDAAIDSHIKLGITPTGATVFTHDPADKGGDSKAYACRKGILYHDIGEIASLDGNEACDIATGKAIQANADLFVWDGDGMGALLRRQIGEAFKGIKCDLRMYRGSNEVEDKKQKYDGLGSLGSRDNPKTNRDMFYNKRAQYYMKLAQRFYNTYQAVVEGKYQDPDTLISISSNIELINKLRSEVCRIPRKPNATGKIQLMSKDDMKSKLHIDSPGMADCLAMGEELPYVKTKKKPMEFDTISR